MEYCRPQWPRPSHSADEEVVLPACPGLGPGPGDAAWPRGLVAGHAPGERDGCLGA